MGKENTVIKKYCYWKV